MTTYRMTVAGQRLTVEADAPSMAAEKALRGEAIGTHAIVDGKRRGLRRRYRKGARGVVRAVGRDR